MESYGRTKAVITKIEKFVGAENKCWSRNVIKNKLDVLERNFTKFTREIDEVFEDELISEAKYVEEFQLYSSKYDSIKMILNKIYEESGTDNDEGDTDTETDIDLKQVVKQQAELLKNLCISRPDSQSFRLPNVIIKPFDGTYGDWRPFRDMFCRSVKDNKALSPVEKLYYLRSYLRGSAERIVKHMAVTDANFEVAWKLLEDRYENDKAILDDIIKRFQSTKRIRESKSELKHFVTSFDEMLTALDGLSEYGAKRDPWIINNALGVLDDETIELWARHSVGIKEPTCTDLLKFLQSRQSQIEIVRCAASTVPIKLGKPKASQVMTITRTSCFYCNGDHFLVSCQKLVSQPLETRIKVLSENRLCFNCLRRGHMANKCRSSVRYAKCKGKHNTIIHGTINNYSRTLHVNSDDNAIETIEPKSSANRVVAQTSEAKQTVLLPTVEVLVRCRDGRLICCRALMDSGSQVNLISEAMFLKLGISRSAAKRSLTGISTESAQVSRGAAPVTIYSRMELDRPYSMDFLIVRNLIGSIPEREVVVQEEKALSNYQLADNHFRRPGRIDMLIGVQGYCQLTVPGKNFIRRDQLWMINSVFGWLICGGHENSTNSKLANVTVVADMDKQLQRLWRIDGLEEDERCEKELEKASRVERGVDGRYIVRLPFVNGSPLLGESFSIAKRQFKRLEEKLNREPKKKMRYADFMAEYEKLNHMQEMTAEELSRNEDCCYIPHHGVYQRNKIRVVFNAASKTTNGRSLNDELLTGPNLQARIVDVLTRIREHKFLFVTDVKKMYRQIRLHPEHSSFLRILWRNDSESPLKHYKLLTVTYGTNCAPYDALRVMNQLADDEQEAYPQAAEIIRHKRYMDDLFGGDNDLDKAIDIRNQLIHAMRNGGFELSKWASNSSALLRDIDSKDLAMEPTVFEDDDLSVKTLGVLWHPSDGRYSFQISLDPIVGLTKRGLLSELSRVFDPLGWLAPVIVLAKLLMQEVWRLKLDWDASLPANIANEWEKLRNDLPCVRTVRVERWLGDGPRVELHGFADASGRAYGAVIYCRVFSASGKVKTTLIAAKSRVAPITPPTIPRLELCAAVMLSQLMRHFQLILQHRSPTIQCWSDSKVVLCWISRQSADLNVFVRNRVSKILINCPKECWRYIPTKQNPADAVSRGQYPSQLIKNDLWWQGPSIMEGGENSCEHWRTDDPNVCDLVNSELIAKSRLCHVTVQSREFDVEEIIQRFSSLFRMKKVLAWMLRWRRLDGELNPSRSITLTEMNSAFRKILFLVQSRAFRNEYDQCLANKGLSASSRIKHLNPFIDEKGLMRVGGRLANSNLPTIEKHPIIVPCGHVALLIVRDVHLNNMHCGARQTIFLCRRFYWILNLTRLVKRELRGCERCRRYSSATYQPQMSSLPTIRVTEARAFCRTGVDYAGPFTLRAFRHRGKLTTNGYVVVFICLATKAVHFELVSSLDTGSFLAAYERFIARRGNCLELWSDNGRNFVGANNYLRNLFGNIEKAAVSSLIRDAMAKRNVEWNFIPPYAPHFGGIWESAVRIMKHHLKRTVSNQVLSIEEFSTLLCRIEMIMNSRPLAPMTNDPEDCSVITPNHFLIGEGVGPLDLSRGSANMSLAQRLRLIEKLTSEFWRNWEREYLRSIMMKSKWTTSGRQPKVGELVIVRRDFQHPGLWRRARIRRLIYGSDGIARVAEVFDGGTTRTEAIRSLIPLELNATHSAGGGCSSNR